MKPEDVAGLIPNELGEVLAELAAKVPSDQAIVEIGSFKGKSTCYLAAGAARGNHAHVFAVDPWSSTGNVTGRFGFAEPSTEQAFHENIAAAGFTDRVTALKGFSRDVAATWKGPKIGLLYIDGDHSAKSVNDDFQAWRSHLVAGATVAFDDWDTPRNPGVGLVVTALHRKGIIKNLMIRAERLAIVSYHG